MRVRRSVTDAGFRLMSSGHRAILQVSGGRVLRTAFGMPVVELRTIGRKTGQRRTTMLTAPLHDETRVVLVASKGGDDRDPQWYGNLTAQSGCRDRDRGGQTRMLWARTASASEAADLWPQIVAAYKGYGGDQNRTERTIPIVICEPGPH